MQLHILEETSLYILSLEQKLLEKFQKSGLPDSLRHIKEPISEDIKHSEANNPAAGDNMIGESHSDKNIDMKTLKSYLHEFAKVKIEKTVEEEEGNHKD